MKNVITYEVALTGDGRNFYTLYRHYTGNNIFTSTFIKNLSIDFDQAVEAARVIAGEDEETDEYIKRLVTDADEAEQILRGDDVLRFGKYRGYRIEDVFATDKKYIDWLAKGGPVKDGKTGYWNNILDDNSSIRQHSIGLLVGSGDWIERNGKLMPVAKANFLDYLESLKPNPDYKDGQKVKGLKVKLVGRVFETYDLYSRYPDIKKSFKLIDEFGYVINVSTTGRVRIEPDVWYEIGFTVSLYKGKVYAKRLKVTQEPMDLEEFEESGK